MKSKKMALLAIAIVAIGIFALPGTVSLFSGQHSWYDLSAGCNDVPCEKCHAEIGDEMTSGENGAHRNLTCAMCHRTCFNGYTYGSGEDNGTKFEPGEEAHAAAVVQCMDCHGISLDSGALCDGGHYGYPEYTLCWKCHGDPSGWFSRGTVDFISAGGFGLNASGKPGPISPGDTGNKSAHKQFVLDSIGDPLMEGANEACIACHTRIGVNITWKKSTALHFNASEAHDGTWTIEEFTAHGSNYTHTTYPNNWTG